MWREVGALSRQDQGAVAGPGGRSHQRPAGGLIAARLERVPTIVRVAELFTGPSVSGHPRALPAWGLVRSTESSASVLLCASGLVARQFSGRRKRILTSYSPIGAEPAPATERHSGELTASGTEVP